MFIVYSVLYIIFLHLYRIYGCIAEQPDNHAEDSLRAIRENVAGLEKVSGERIWLELRKILEGRFAGDLMKTMISVGLSPYIGRLILVIKTIFYEFKMKISSLNFNAITMRNFMACTIHLM